MSEEIRTLLFVLVGGANILAALLLFVLSMLRPPGTAQIVLRLQIEPWVNEPDEPDKEDIPESEEVSPVRVVAFQRIA